jgi:hypothetical protein
VRAATREAAGTLAGELTRAALETLQRGQPSDSTFGARIVGDFEFDNDSWAATGVGTGVAETGRVPAGRYGGGALRALCRVTTGCGVARVIEGIYPARRRVTMTLWLRGLRPSLLLLRLGAADADDDSRKQVSVGSAWQRVVVRWRPKYDRRRVALAVNNAGPGSSDVDLDGVLLLTGTGPLTVGRERRMFTEHNYAYAAPVRVVTSRTGSTLRWAAVGAGIGLAVSFVGVSAATLARSRKGLSA